MTRVEDIDELARGQLEAYLGAEHQRHDYQQNPPAAPVLPENTQANRKQDKETAPDIVCTPNVYSTHFYVTWN